MSQISHSNRTEEYGSQPEHQLLRNPCSVFWKISTLLSVSGARGWRSLPSVCQEDTPRTSPRQEDFCVIHR
ncbi:hypothetical protein CEXT_192211 [Caerostris extrusa]|uniref:Uncharacterized protein n=1 Tax=Caerostris extrusa TaxID=172846 RepID=A0AAV4WU58_CAEEX|nr:hypothetical protein CEXT_192211 [Caerostris extrusa]